MEEFILPCLRFTLTLHQRSKMMKKVLTMIAFGALIMASCDNAPKFCVDGTIEGAKDSILYFTHSTLDGAQRLDSIKMKENGVFSFKADAPS
jgi:hypothetical protein